MLLVFRSEMILSRTQFLDQPILILLVRRPIKKNVDRKVSMLSELGYVEEAEV